MRALAKLEQVLPGRLRPKFSALRQSVSVLAGNAATVDPQTLTALSSAIAEQRVVSFRYTPAGAAPGRRLVEPYKLVSTGRRWYLAAWDLERRDWRTFRMDRCQSIPSSRGRYFPRPLPAKDMAAYVQDSITRFPYRYDVVLRLAAPLAELVDRILPEAAELQDDGPGFTILRGGWDSLDLPLMHLAGLGLEFEILAPAEMRERARSAAALLQRAAEAQPSAEIGKAVDSSD